MAVSNPEKRLFAVHAAEINFPKSILCLKSADSTVEVFINPEIIWESEELFTPDPTKENKPKAILVHYYNEKGEALNKELEEEEAWIFQEKFDIFYPPEN